MQDMQEVKEHVAEIFAMLEAKLAVAEREYHEINSRYREIDCARTAAYKRWKAAEEAFERIDELQGIINEEEEETSE